MKTVKLLKIYIERILYFKVQYFLFRKKNSNPTDVKNIVVVRLNHIGDLFISLSSIFCLKERFPEAKITLVTGIWNKGLVEFQNQLFDNVCYYNLNKNCRNKSQRMSLLQRKKILKKLRQENYDLCTDFDGSWEFLFLYIFSKIKYLSTAKYLRFYQNLEQLKVKKSKFKYDVNNSYEGDNIFEVVKQFSAPDKREEYALAVNSEIKNKVAAFFAGISGQGQLNENKQEFSSVIKNEKKIVGIHPAASIKEKMWTSDGFARLCDYLITDKKLSVIIFGAKEDMPYIQDIIEKSECKEKINIQTAFNIGEFITAVSYCDYFICLDSLAQHIVRYFDLPSLIIYTSENSVSTRWSKASENIKTVLLKNKTDYETIFEKLSDFN